MHLRQRTWKRISRPEWRNQKNLYASYNAEEAGRLDDAIIKSAGKYTVLCVCDDTDKANEILKENGF